MATLDASFVLDLPLFRRDDLVLLRTTVAQQTDGTAEPWPTGGIAFSGVAQPFSGRDLVQTPEGDQVEGDMVFYTRTELTAGSLDLAADQVECDGERYKIVSAKPWRFGSGYTYAVGKAVSLNPSAIGDRDGPGFLG